MDMNINDYIAVKDKLNIEDLPCFYAKDKMDLSIGFRCNFTPKILGENIYIHHHDYYEFLFLPEDGCGHWANKKFTYLPKGTLIFIRPDDCHDLYGSNEEKEQKKLAVIHIGICREIIESLFNYLGKEFPSEKLLSLEQPHYVVLNNFHIEKVSSLFRELNIIEFNNKQRKALSLRYSLIKIFINYFSDLGQHFEQNTDFPSWIIKSREEMKKIENFSIGMDRMVEISGHSKEHLCRTHKKLFNTTPTEYINEIRLNYIANMLINSYDSILDICYDCGYQSLSYLYSQFRKKYGISPQKFRNRFQQGPYKNSPDKILY